MGMKGKKNGNSFDRQRDQARAGILKQKQKKRLKRKRLKRDIQGFRQPY